MKQLDREDEKLHQWGNLLVDCCRDRVVGLSWRKQVSGDMPWKINFVPVPFLSLLLPSHHGEEDL